MRQRLEAQEAKEKEHARNVADTKKAMEWLEDIDRLRKEIAELAGESERLQGELEAFVPEREKLNQAQKAASLDGLYAQLTTTRKQQTEEEIDLEAHTGKVAGLQSLVTERAEALKNAAQQSLLAKQALKEAGPQLQEVRALDQRLAEQRKMAAEEQKACDKAAATLQAHEKAHGSEQIKRENTGKVLQLASSYLETHAQDEWLVGGLAGVEEQVKGLVDKQKEIARKQGEQVKATAVRDKAAKTVAEREKQSVLRRQSWQQATQKRNEGKEAWEQLLGGRSLREYRAEQETLLRKMAFFSRVAELQEHRARLQDGEPCPLCGAAEHPYAKGNVPVPDETEKKLESLRLLIEKAEEQEALVRKLEEAETRARDKLAEAEKLEILAANDKTTAENALKTVVDALAEWQGDYARRKQTVFDTLLGLGIEPAQDADMALVLEPLRVRLASWQTHSKKKGEAEKQLAVIDTEMSRLRALLESQNAVLADKKERLEQVRQTIAVESEKRKALYGDKKPEEEEARLYEAVTAREMEETRAREQHQEAHERLIATQTQIESLRTSREKRAPVLQRLQEEYSQAVETAGFSSEEQYLQALLSHEQREQLAFRAKQLDEREVELKTRKAERHASLDKELVRSLTDQSLEALLPIYKKGEEELEAVRGDIAEIKIKLHDQEVAKERIKEKQQAIEAQGKECGRWDALSKLIGSADGKKFRNFAQGLTLEVMLHHANHQLRTMTDRYLLKRDDATSLQFNVVDDYQGGEIRSTKNLSGGESFLVSLALALGLSQMVSQNVRVDSLFLDEGFGSLDEDALDSALTTLSGLQHEGKLIGVISHVPALKARVGVQIEVTPKTGGRSSISGPGCRRLDNELTPRKPGKRS
ncbi:MAG TPA: SbcC/MukB-like Walker B domain-containing protein [Polyangiaceae bacterium]|mgnify:FL=1|nr:SbcC/MukB-like Walker B domain-containing protein [Polyangiaceae bacterium]